MVLVESVEASKAEMLKREVMMMVDFMTKGRIQNSGVGIQNRNILILWHLCFKLFEAHSACNFPLWQES